jgi:hypothetical protein
MLRDNIAVITLEKLTIRVKMIAAKPAYGNWLILIEPEHGNGSQWVNINRLSLSELSIKEFKANGIL